MGIVAVATAGLVWWMARRPATIEASGMRLVDCAVAADAACLFPYLSSWERDALELDRAKFEAFVRDWYRPRFDVRPEGDFSFAGSPGSFGELSVSRNVTLAGGGETTVDLQVARTDGGYVSPYIVGQLWLTAVLYPARAEGSDVRGPSRQRILASAARVEGPKLEALGIRGLILDRTVGFQTWSDLATRFDERAAALEKRIAQADTQRPSSR
ncbi:MAG: hypothetical protein AB7F50_04080 [Fimbriimonadaceae bacterium]